MSGVRLQYMIVVNEVKGELDSRDPDALGIAERLDLNVSGIGTTAIIHSGGHYF